MNRCIPLITLLFLTGMAGRAMAADIEPGRLRDHVAVLASDDYMGRETGGPADRKTTAYIANAFAQAGLSPAGANGTWSQPVPLVRRSAMGWQVDVRVRNGRAVTLPPEMLALIGTRALDRIKDAPVVFIGHGIVDPATGRDDLAGADLKGAVLLRLADSPPEYAVAGGAAPPDLAARRALYRSRGAIAEIAVNAADDVEFERLQMGYQRGLMKLDAREDALAVTGHVRAAVIASLLTQAGASLDDLKTRAALLTFRALPLDLRFNADVETRLRRFRSANVVARLDGTVRAGEAVILTAHWDGYGICAPRAARDRICNGAIDNASGVAGLIELARALRQGRQPERSILFVATTGEEYGLLGAEYYARYPVMPLADTVGGVNLDMIALRGRGAKVGIIGQGLTTLDPIVREAARAQGRAVLDDPSIQQYFRRSDQYALVRRGVPVVVATGIFSRETAKDDVIDRYFDERYHRPGDELAAIPSFEGAAEDMDLVLQIVRAIANGRETPRWVPKSPYHRIEPR